VIINQHRGLWRYILVPILVNIVVGILVYAGMLFAGFQAIDNLLAGTPEWATLLAVVLRVVLVVALFMSTGFVLLRFGVVLGSPWYSQLSERLEHIFIEEKVKPHSTSAATIVRDIWDALSFEVKKLLLLVLLGLPLLLLNLLPAFGSMLAGIGWVALGATIVCLDFLDPSLARRRLSFREKLTTIRRSMPASVGFSLICLALISVPFLNLLAIPLCVTAGTLFFCDNIWEQQGFRSRPPESAPAPPPPSS
jgi:CysZ protein